MSDWKNILKYRGYSTRLRRYMNYAKANQHNSRDLMTMEQFAERVHRKIKSMGGAYDVATVIEKEIFDEINQLDANDPNMPFDIPFSYEEYMKKFGEAIQEEGQEDIDFLNRHNEMLEGKRRKRSRKLNEKRENTNWDKYKPKPLKSPKEEESE